MYSMIDPPAAMDAPEKWDAHLERLRQMQERGFEVTPDLEQAKALRATSAQLHAGRSGKASESRTSPTPGKGEPPQP